MGNLEEINKFQKRENLPRLDQKESENINRPITSNKNETRIKNLSIDKSPEPDGFTDKSYQALRNELVPIVLKLFQKYYRERNTPTLILRGHYHFFPHGNLWKGEFSVTLMEQEIEACSTSIQ